MSTGLGAGGNQAQAFAGPQGAFAQAGSPGSFGSMSGNCCGGPNGNAMCNNFGGGPQNAFQAGFKQGMMAAKMKKLMRKMHRLMAQMGGAGGCGGPGFGGPGSRPVADSGSWLFAFSWLWTSVPGRGEKI